jgi:hypothetical protein
MQQTTYKNYATRQQLYNKQQTHLETSNKQGSQETKQPAETQQATNIQQQQQQTYHMHSSHELVQ